MNETQMIDELRSALEHDTQDVWARPDLASRVEAKGRRRLMVRGVVAGVPVVGLAVAMLAQSGAAPAQSGPAPAQGSAGSPAKVETVAYVKDQVVAALGADSNYIVELTRRMPGDAQTVDAFDPVNGDWRQTLTTRTDKVVTWTQYTTTGNTRHSRRTWVNYTSRTWSSSPDEVTLGSSTPAPRADGVQLGPFTDPGQIKQLLQNGDVAITGHGKVNGRDAIQLRVTGTNAPQVDLWVDANTYQPVRWGLSSTPDVFIDISWVQRTAEVANSVDNPQIPAGFTHVADTKK